MFSKEPKEKKPKSKRPSDDGDIPKSKFPDESYDDFEEINGPSKTLIPPEKRRKVTNHNPPTRSNTRNDDNLRIRSKTPRRDNISEKRPTQSRTRDNESLRISSKTPGEKIPKQKIPSQSKTRDNDSLRIESKTPGEKIPKEKPSRDPRKKLVPTEDRKVRPKKEDVVPEDNSRSFREKPIRKSRTTPKKEKIREKKPESGGVKRRIRKIKNKRLVPPSKTRTKKPSRDKPNFIERLVSNKSPKQEKRRSRSRSAPATKNLKTRQPKKAEEERIAEKVPKEKVPKDEMPKSKVPREKVPK